MLDQFGMTTHIHGFIVIGSHGETFYWIESSKRLVPLGDQNTGGKKKLAKGRVGFGLWWRMDVCCRRQPVVECGMVRGAHHRKGNLKSDH